MKVYKNNFRISILFILFKFISKGFSFIYVGFLSSLRMISQINKVIESFKFTLFLLQSSSMQERTAQ